MCSRFVFELECVRVFKPLRQCLRILAFSILMAAASQHPPDRSQQWLEVYQVDFKASRVFLSLTEGQREEIRRQGGLGSGNTSAKLIKRIRETCRWWKLKNLVANGGSQQGPPSPPEQAAPVASPPPEPAVVDAAAAPSPTALPENDSDDEAAAPSPAALSENASDSDTWGDWQVEGKDS